MKLAAGAKAPNFSYNTPYETNVNFYASLRARHNILIFSRYIGCPLCQLKLMQTASEYAAVARAGGEIYFVLQSTVESAKEQLEEMGVRFPVILDPDEALYKLYGVSPAKSKLGLASPTVIGLIGQAKREGIAHGKHEGNELQLPATFIVGEHGVVEYARYGRHGADYPSLTTLLSLLEK